MITAASRVPVAVTFVCHSASPTIKCLPSAHWHLQLPLPPCFGPPVATVSTKISIKLLQGDS